MRALIAQVTALQEEEVDVHPRMMETLARQLVSERSAGVSVNGVSRRRSQWSGGKSQSLRRASELWARLVPARRSEPECLAIPSN
jgi:hypothetical protein